MFMLEKIRMIQFKNSAKKEIAESVKGINKGDVLLSQILYQLMNFASGGGLAGMPLSAMVSILITKGTYDGHRYHKGDKNFHNKRKYFYGNMYVGLAGGTIPRIIDNAQNLLTENNADTLLKAARIIAENISNISVVDGGLWNEHALIAVLGYQLYNHIKHIIKTPIPAPEIMQ
jgi:hypothetical protein